MTATLDSTQLRQWQGDFGDAYVDRNAATPDMLRVRTRAWAEILRATDVAPPQSILEGGCSIGLNLRVLPRLTGAELWGLEPNAKARARLQTDGVLPADRILAGSLQRIPLADASVDMTFTSGVLIHVPPSELGQAVDELHRTSRRWIACIEYFSPRPETVPYRGHDELLFKRDFGAFWMDRHRDLECVATGFLWHRTSGWDDATWWLFRKR